MASRAASPYSMRSPAPQGPRFSEYADGPGPGALYRGPSRPWWRAASLPLAAAALVAPALAALLPDQLAPALGALLLLALLAHRVAQGRWPRPPGAALPALLGLAAWGGASALWAPDPAAAALAAGLLGGFALLGAAGAVVAAEDGPAGRRALGVCALGGILGGLAAAAGSASPAGPAVLALMLPVLLRLRAAAPLRWLLLVGGTLALLLPEGGSAAGMAAMAGLLAAALATLGGRAAASLLALLLAAGLLASPVLLPAAARTELAAILPGLAGPAARDAAEAAPRRPAEGAGLQSTRAPAGAAPLRLHRELGWIGLGLAAFALLALGWGAAPAGIGVIAAAALLALSGAAWEPWWLAAPALAGALAAGLSARRV